MSEKEEQIKQHETIIEKELERVTQARKDLEKRYQHALGLLEKEERTLKNVVEDSLHELETHRKPNHKHLANTLRTFENRLAELERRLDVKTSRTVGLGQDRELKRLAHDHTEGYRRFLQITAKARSDFARKARKAYPEAALAQARKEILESAWNQAKDRLRDAHREAQDAIEHRLPTLRAGLDKAYEELERKLTTSLLAQTEVDLPTVLGTLERSAAEASEELRDRLEAYLDGFFAGERDVVTAVQTDMIEKLQATVSRNLELVQLGLAVEVADHEMGRLHKGIRADLQVLRRLTRRSERATSLVENLSASFQHLEQRYLLLSPLYRGSYRVKTSLDGKQIFEYVCDFLAHELEGTGTDLEATAEFRQTKLFEVAGVVLPVFVNLVNNSIYWVRTGHERRVKLGRVQNVLTVTDTGPGIHETMLEDVFEPFFTTKPGGRGLGLYVAKANLELAGHKIWATNDPVYRSQSGACICLQFCLEPNEGT